jgi:hypothetical protein
MADSSGWQRWATARRQYDREAIDPSSVWPCPVTRPRDSGSEPVEASSRYFEEMLKTLWRLVWPLSSSVILHLSLRVDNLLEILKRNQI